MAVPDADEDILRDTLEGMTKLAEMLAEVVRSCLEDQSLPRPRGLGCPRCMPQGR